MLPPTICRDAHASINNTERQREREEQHLVGHCVLVGEPLPARQVLVHRGHDLQDVVVRGQSCKRKKDGQVWLVHCPPGVSWLRLSLAALRTVRCQLVGPS